MSAGPNINPFLFLQPYGLNDHYKLMGRQDEGEVLLDLLQWKDIIVVYGRSGVGKTSFINNTLSEEIERINWLPIRITRLLNINHSLKRGIQYALAERSLDKIHNNEIATDTLAINEPSSTDADTVQLMKELYIKWNRPVYLIIDQLEELFLVGTDEEQNIFLETLGALIDNRGIEKKIILVLREEHLGYIQEVERILSGVFQDAMCLKDIKKEKGSEIFESLLTSKNEKIQDQLNGFAQKISSGAIKDRMLESCSNGEVFNAQKLQILLFLLWEKIQTDEKPEAVGTIEVEVERLCASADPLKEYLDTSVNTDLASGARLKKAPYWFILHNAISDANTKKPVALSEFDKLIWQSLGYDEQVNAPVKRQKDLQMTIEDVAAWCDQLVGKRILQKFLITQPGGKKESYYQLRHDTLVEPIKSLYTGLPLRFPKKLTPHKLAQNPYMGLRQYDYDNISGKGNTNSGLGRKNIPSLPVLYGRETVINEYVAYLKNTENKYLVVVGDSGTGKSSLVKGGLLPAMQQAGFGTSTFQPGADLDAFTKDLQTLFNKYGNVLPTGAPVKHCLYIDQFEECYTFRQITADEKDRFETFLQFLTNEINQRNGNFKLVVSIRHDYAHEFDRRIKDWRSYKKLLRYPNQDEIFDIIVGPAYERGIGFQPASLPETIAADAINTSYFLPLLSFTMETLYQKEVLKPYEEHRDISQPKLTIEGYKEAEGIVKCLQNEFTDTYHNLSEENKRFFIEIMARMIIIKDTIPKARPLPKNSLNYVEPCKADTVQKVLKAFIPRFFRERDLIVDNCITRCYEPIHDSLLIYCDEIRQIVNKVQEPHAQMYLQPRIEAAVREWKGSRNSANEMQQNNAQEHHNANEKLEQIIQKKHWELEPLFDLVLDNGNPAPLNWLFKEEFELVKAGKERARELRDQEKTMLDQKVKQLKLEINQQKLLQEKAKAEQDLALAEEQKKQQELEARTAKANEIIERRSKWLIALISLFISLGGAGYFYFDKMKLENENSAQIINNQKDSLERSQQQKNYLSQFNNQLEAEQRLTQIKADSLDKKNKENIELLVKLKKNALQLEKANKELEQKRNALTKEGNEKSKIIDNYIATNEELIRKNDELKAAKTAIDSLTNERMAILAEYYKMSSPALSYRLAEEALKANASPNALRLKAGLAKTSQYFESMVVNNVISHAVSPDGNRIVTLEQAEVASRELMRIWSADGKQIGQTVNLDEKVDVTAFSRDNKMVLLGTDNSVRIYDVQAARLGPAQLFPDVLFTRFSETDNRVLVISGNKLTVLDGNSVNLTKLREISFEHETAINNASFRGNKITLITARGIRHWDISRRNKPAAKNLPQSFIIHATGKVLAFEKPLFGGTRKLVLFDNNLKEEWEIKVPDKAYNLITEFVPGTDGRYAIIKFNEKEDVIQYTQQRQQQQQQQIKQKQPYTRQPDVKGYNASPLAISGSVYSLDLSNGILQLIDNWNARNESFILSAQNDALFEFGNGSILKYPVQLSRPAALQHRWQLSIGDNTRFKKIALAGSDRDHVLSVDANNQLKLWRYGNAAELSSKGLLWMVPKAELEKLLSIK